MISLPTLVIFCLIGLVALSAGRVVMHLIKAVVIGAIIFWVVLMLNGNGNPCHMHNGEFSCNLNTHYHKLF